MRNKFSVIFFIFSSAVALAVTFLLVEHGLIPRIPTTLPFTAGVSQFTDTVVGIKKQVHIASEPLRKAIGSPNAFLTQAGTLEWTNTFRMQNGFKTLTADAELNQAASYKLNNMFTNQYFAHVSPDSKGPDHWVELTSYNYISIGENLALGNFENDEALVQAWMDSPGHRENILNSSFENIGVAVGKGVFEGQQTWLAVQVFGRPISACPQLNNQLIETSQANQTQLSAWEKDLELLRQRLAAEQPKGRVTKQEADTYNQIVEEYNALAAQYNQLAEATKAIVDQYNAQVAAYNQCAGE